MPDWIPRGWIPQGPAGKLFPQNRLSGSLPGTSSGYGHCIIADGQRCLVATVPECRAKSRIRIVHIGRPGVDCTMCRWYNLTASTQATLGVLCECRRSATATSQRSASAILPPMRRHEAALPLAPLRAQGYGAHQAPPLGSSLGSRKPSSACSHDA